VSETDRRGELAKPSVEHNADVSEYCRIVANVLRRRRSGGLKDRHIREKETTEKP